MRISKGYILAVIAIFLYAVSDAIGKYFVKGYGVANVMFMKTVARCFPFVLYAFFRRVNPYKTEHMKMNFLRGVCASGISFAFLNAYRFAPMTDVVVVSQTSAIIVIPLSVILLHEKFNIYTTVAIFLGFLGIICAFRPSGDIFQLGILFALVAALLSAANKVLVKKLSFTDNELTMIFYHETILLMLSLISGFDFSLPVQVIFPLIVSGFISSMALYLMLHAYKFAECTHIASAGYLILIPSTIIDFFVYDKSPDLYIFVGAIFILIGCVIINRKKPPSRC